jgi:hypothetical protein
MQCWRELDLQHAPMAAKPSELGEGKNQALGLGGQANPKPRQAFKTQDKLAGVPCKAAGSSHTDGTGGRMDRWTDAVGAQDQRVWAGGFSAGRWADSQGGRRAIIRCPTSIARSCAEISGSPCPSSHHTSPSSLNLPCFAVPVNTSFFFPLPLFGICLGQRPCSSVGGLFLHAEILLALSTKSLHCTWERK